MEAAGLAFGVLALAPLLAQCLDCYRLIQSCRSISKDYAILDTQFDNLELRLASWGQACGLNHSKDGIFSDAAQHRAIEKTLQQVFRLLHEAYQLKQKHGLKEVPKPSTQNHSARLLEEPESSVRPGLRYHGLRIVARARRKQDDLASKTRWMIVDKAKFTNLVRQLRIFVEDLEHHIKHVDASLIQRQIIREELQAVTDIDTLREVEEASESEDDIVSVLARQRLNSLRGVDAASEFEDDIVFALGRQRLQQPSEISSIDYDLRLNSNSVSSLHSYHTAAEEPTADSWDAAACFPNEAKSTIVEYVKSLLAGASPLIKLNKSYLGAEYGQMSKYFQSMPDKREGNASAGLFQTFLCTDSFGFLSEPSTPFDREHSKRRLLNYARNLKCMVVAIDTIDSETGHISEALERNAPVVNDLNGSFLAQHLIESWILCLRIIRHVKLWSCHSSHCQVWSMVTEWDMCCQCDYSLRDGYVRDDVSLEFLAGMRNDLQDTSTGLEKCSRTIWGTRQTLPKIVVSFH